jgi:large subunit ribosomal protein L18
MLGKKAAEAKVGRVILDIGMQSPVIRSRVYAALKGAVDAGLDIPHSEDVLPEDENVMGKPIEEFAKKLKESDEEKYKKQFSRYLKENIDPSTISSKFEEVKNKITGVQKNG